MCLGEFNEARSVHNKKNKKKEKRIKSNRSVYTVGPTDGVRNFQIQSFKFLDSSQKMWMDMHTCISFVAIEPAVELKRIGAGGKTNEKQENQYKSERL